MEPLPPGAEAETVLCCSHVELDYFEVYFLYETMGSLTFQVIPFLLWKFRNHKDPFVWISVEEKEQCSFLCLGWLFSAGGMIYFCLSR